MVNFNVKKFSDLSTDSVVLFVNKKPNFDKLSSIFGKRAVDDLKLFFTARKDKEKKARALTINVDGVLKKFLLADVCCSKGDSAVDLQCEGASVSDAISCVGAAEFCAFSTCSTEEEQQICEVLFGLLQKSYRFDRYLTEKSSERKSKFSTLCYHAESIDGFKAKWSRYQQILDSVFLVRDIVNEPANVIHPESLSEMMKQDLTKLGVKVDVIGEAEMEKLGMRCLLGVGMASAKESKMVVMRYDGAGKGAKGTDKGDVSVAFVGKGVTFDSGGLSIKPAESMEDMKDDMAGAAVVYGTMKLLASRKAKVNVVGVVGLVENMVDGNAQKPGDIVKSMSGQTVEVLNTDAEGRLVLADVLHYVTTKFKPEYTIDLATLTGAIVVALGSVYAACYSNDDKLAQMLVSAGQKSGDLLWRMPMHKDYDKLINSNIADMKNITGQRGAGSITAAHFLERFIGSSKWSHLDIAGVAHLAKDTTFAKQGATGYGVKLLDAFVRDNFEGK